MTKEERDAFAEAVSRLVAAHREEVAHLRGQAARLEASLAIARHAPDLVASDVNGRPRARKASDDHGGGTEDSTTLGPAPCNKVVEGEPDPGPGAEPVPSTVADSFKNAEPVPGAEAGGFKNAEPVPGAEAGGFKDAEPVLALHAEGAAPNPALQSSSETSRAGGGGTCRAGAEGGCVAPAQHATADCAEAILAEAAKYETSAARRMRMIRSPNWTVPGGQQNLLTWLVNHPLFDSLCAVMILFNSMLVGISAEQGTEAEQEETWIVVSGYFCSLFFLTELIFRMATQGRAYFNKENRRWNIFDMLLVLSSIMDFLLNDILSAGSSTGAVAKSSGSILKILKMFRIVRVFRVFRFFRELSLLALLIVDSLCSLLWALLLLIMVIYVFAVWFTLQATDYLQQHSRDSEPMASEVHRQFGSLWRTVYSLVQAMLGGVSWGVVSDALMAVDLFSAGLFFFYITFVVLAVLNIITGVFVDNAFETARMHREFLVQKEMELREKYIASLHRLFEQMDLDGSGSITLEEVHHSLEADARVHSYFQALGLDPEDLERLFTLLDEDMSGELELSEFLSGCLRLKGQARSIDVHALIMLLKKLDADSQERFQKLEASLDALPQRGEVGRTSAETMSF
mmetsp:Transcript_77831/g.241175  ORF Transcript_77831/g.241175 Transcript_77831/m.241175 type:complete len:628 (-) Transcript_77831:2-1885(-)